jgi:glycerophosphoryl diester phosphodiesterase
MKLCALFFLVFSLPALSFDWQGHRGARGLYPENTIGSMLEALKYPVTTLELDVVVSADKKIIVSHEPWMSPEICTHPEGKRFAERGHNIFKMTAAEIVRFDCGQKPHPRFPQQQKVSVGKPQLRTLVTEVEPLLRQLNRTEVSYNVEIKSTPEDERRGFQPEHREFADLVVGELRSLLPLSRFTIQSFDWRVLRYLHQKHPEVQLVALREDRFRPEQVLKELGFAPAVFSPYFKLLTPEDVKFFHSQGVKVIPWTVNSVEDMRRLKEIGVDGIITDYPNLINEAEARACPEGTNLFEGDCVQIPKNAEAWEKNPGWRCQHGYVQKRRRCVKIKVPTGAYLLEDGKSWACKEGFERYRGTCRKQR